MNTAVVWYGTGNKITIFETKINSKKKIFGSVANTI